MRSVRELSILENIPVIVRTALNVPVIGGEVTSDYRIRRALPTIRFLQERGAKVVLISHIGEKGTETLRPAANILGKHLSRVSFCDHTIGEAARSAVRSMRGGDVLVLENLRRHTGEASNSTEFARELSALGDAFVQDSFDTCHRAHASIVGIPKFLPSYAGLLLEEEVRSLSEALRPKSPSLAVIGGAKFSTKEGVLKSLLERYDRVFVGGALANDFFKAHGFSVGKSLVSAADPARAKELLKNKKFALPLDARVVPLGTKGPVRISHINSIRPDENILDAGPETERLLAGYASGARTILWNGPLGNYENGFSDATDSFARAVTKSSARSYIGGNDTVAAIERIGLLSEFSFVSSGGGAMLEYLSHSTLPGIEALQG